MWMRLGSAALDRRLGSRAIASRTASPEKGCQWGDENERTGDEAETVESDLKQLMADVSRAMEKAQEAVARLTSSVETAAADTKSSTRLWLTLHSVKSK